MASPFNTVATMSPLVQEQWLPNSHDKCQYLQSWDLRNMMFPWLSYLTSIASLGLCSHTTVLSVPAHSLLKTVLGMERTCPFFEGVFPLTPWPAQISPPLQSHHWLLNPCGSPPLAPTDHLMMCWWAGAMWDCLSPPYLSTLFAQSISLWTQQALRAGELNTSRCLMAFRGNFEHKEVRTDLDSDSGYSPDGKHAVGSWPFLNLNFFSITETGWFLIGP